MNIFQVLDKIPTLKKIIQYSGEPSHPGALSWSKVVTLGSSEDKGELDSQLLARQGEMAANQCCCLVYTSGTTGTPKGVMLSHDNLLFSTYREEGAQLGRVRFCEECSELDRKADLWLREPALHGRKQA